MYYKEKVLSLEFANAQVYMKSGSGMCPEQST